MLISNFSIQSELFFWDTETASHNAFCLQIPILHFVPMLMFWLNMLNIHLLQLFCLFKCIEFACTYLVVLWPNFPQKTISYSQNKQQFHYFGDLNYWPSQHSMFCSFCSYLRKGQLNVILRFSQFGIHFDSFGHCYGLNYKTSTFSQIAKM